MNEPKATLDALTAPPAYPSGVRELTVGILAQLIKARGALFGGPRENFEDWATTLHILIIGEPADADAAKAWLAGIPIKTCRAMIADATQAVLDAFPPTAAPDAAADEEEPAATGAPDGAAPLPNSPAATDGSCPSSPTPPANSATHTHTSATASRSAS